MHYNKIRLVLDLDETLIHTIPIKESDVIEIENFPSDKFSILQLPNFICMVFLRPYLKEFLHFIFNYFEVSIWTAGNTMYCKEVIKLILTEEQFNKTLFILARDKSNYIDIKTNKIYKNVTFEDEIVKPLEILWNDEDFSINFNELNTLLIDNDSFILKTNPYNSLVLTEFNLNSKNDIVLCCLSNWLDMIKNCNNIQDVNKNIKIISSNCSKLIK